MFEAHGLVIVLYRSWEMEMGWYAGNIKIRVIVSSLMYIAIDIVTSYVLYCF